MSELLSRIALRDPEPGDLNFIVKSWIRTYANSSTAGAISRPRLVAAIKGTILDLLARPTTVVKVACLVGRPSFIFGFVVYETGWPFAVVHYVYVKRGRGNYRGAGIGTHLIAEATKGHTDVRYSHRTSNTDFVLRGARYSPSLARYPKRELQVEQ